MVTGLWSARNWRELASGNRTFANPNHKGEMWIVRVYDDALKISWPLADDQSRRVVSSLQLRPRSTISNEASVKAITPTAAKTSPR